MNSNHLDIPLACDMSVFTSAERELHIQSTRELFQSLQKVHEAENGYEFSFPNNSEIIQRVAEFISGERLCCPFLEFTLKVSPNKEPVRLLLAGPEGTQEFLRAEFSEAFER
jgi:hypothetical protein